MNDAAPFGEGIETLLKEVREAGYCIDILEYAYWWRVTLHKRGEFSIMAWNDTLEENTLTAAIKSALVKMNYRMSNIHIERAEAERVLIELRQRHQNEREHAQLTLANLIPTQPTYRRKL